MKKGQIWQRSLLAILAVISLSGISRCTDPNAPIMEICILGEVEKTIQEKLIKVPIGLCFDERKPDGQKRYTRSWSEMINYISSNPTDTLNQKEYWERKCGRCREAQYGKFNDGP